MLEHLHKPFSVDVVGFPGWRTASAVACLNRGSEPSPSSGVSITLQAVVVLFHMAFDYVFPLIYAVVQAKPRLTS